MFWFGALYGCLSTLIVLYALVRAREYAARAIADFRHENIDLDALLEYAESVNFSHHVFDDGRPLSLPEVGYLDNLPY